MSTDTADVAPATADDLLSIEMMLESRLYLYTLFHKAFGGNPSAELLEALASQRTADMVEVYAGSDRVLEQLDGFLAGLRKKRFDEKFIWNAEAEYTRIFVGPGKLPATPLESVYVSKEAMAFQESTLDVRRIYREHGLEPVRVTHVPDDHISLMLGYMSMLAKEALKSLREGDLEAVGNSLLEQGAFVQQHLYDWVPEYASRVCHVEKAYLYPQLVKGAGDFVQLDLVALYRMFEYIDGEKDELEALLMDHDGASMGAVAGTASRRLPYDSEARFSAVDAVLANIEAIRLVGLEDNELKPTAA